MTTPELYRQLADETERREAAEGRVKELQQELEELRTSLFKREPPELLSVTEAARYIRRSPSYLHKDRIQKPCRIPFIQEMSGGRALYSRTDLDIYIEDRRRGRKKAA